MVANHQKPGFRRNLQCGFSREPSTFVVEFLFLPHLRVNRMIWHLTNEKGLFATLDFKGVVSVEGWAYLQAQRPALSEADRATLDAVKPLIDQLPQGNAYFSVANTRDTSGTLTQSYRSNPTEPLSYYGHIAALGWYVPAGTFKSSSPSKPFEGEPSPERLGWSVMAQLIRPALWKALESLIARCGLHQGYLASDGASNVLKNQHKWTWVSAQMENTVKTCALYLPTQGFMNDKGNTTPLAGARLFESAEAARRTRTSRGLKDAVIVELETRVVGLVPGETLPVGDVKLGGLLAQMDAEKMEQALPEAPTSGSPPRRRM